MSTNLTISELVAVIATNKVSEEQVAQIKTAAAGIAGKFVTGEPITEDESKILAYMSNRVKAAVQKGKAAAEFESKKAEREAAHKKAMAEHKTEVNKAVADFLLSYVKLNKKGEIILKNIPTFDDATQAKAFFNVTLPAVPKMPTLKGNGSTGTKSSTGSKHVVGSPVAGSTNGDIKDLIIAAGETGITRKALVDALVAKRTVAPYNQKAEILGQFVGKAINGGLPQITKVGEMLVWVEPETTEETTK